MLNGIREFCLRGRKIYRFVLYIESSESLLNRMDDALPSILPALVFDDSLSHADVQVKTQSNGVCNTVETRHN